MGSQSIEPLALSTAEAHAVAEVFGNQGTTDRDPESLLGDPAASEASESLRIGPAGRRKGPGVAWAWHDKADASAQAGCWSIADPLSQSDCYRRNGHVPIAETSGSDDISTTKQEVIDFAASRGQSEGELAAEIGDTIPSIEAFVYAAEHTGSSANEALTSLLNFSKASRDPEKAQLLTCLGACRRGGGFRHNNVTLSLGSLGFHRRTRFGRFIRSSEP